MKSFRKYGKASFNTIVIHGGPGAIGAMAPVAKKLSSYCGIIEPFQTQTSIAAEVRALKNLLTKESALPVTLIGHSWGGWMGIIFAAHYPAYVKKLILVGTGPLDEKYAAQIMRTRMLRLNNAKKKQVQLIIEKLKDPKTKNSEIKKLEKLIVTIDSYRPVYYTPAQQFNAKVFRKVWDEGSKLRSTNKLLKLCAKIKCPITVIHGDFDPHPFQGVKKPLAAILPKLCKFILLKKCGHTPWIEKEARDKFYEILEKEVLAKPK